MHFHRYAELKNALKYRPLCDTLEKKLSALVCVEDVYASVRRDHCIALTLMLDPILRSVRTFSVHGMTRLVCWCGLYVCKCSLFEHV